MTDAEEKEWRVTTAQISSEQRVQRLVYKNVSDQNQGWIRGQVRLCQDTYHTGEAAVKWQVLTTLKDRAKASEPRETAISIHTPHI